MKNTIISKLLIVLVLSSASSVGFTQTLNTDKSKQQYCQSYITALTLAMKVRGAYSPQQTYNLYKKDYTAFPIPDKDLKEIINAAYFDPQLSTVSGDDNGFATEVFNSCLRDWKPEHDWKPLK